MNYSALGEKVRKLRNDRHWTQEQLAQRTGISASFLGHIERGTRKAGVDTVVRLANALGCGTDALLSDSLSKPGSDDRTLDFLLRAVRDAYLARHPAQTAPQARGETMSQ